MTTEILTRLYKQNKADENRKVKIKEISLDFMYKIKYKYILECYITDLSLMQKVYLIKLILSLAAVCCLLPDLILERAD